MTTRTPEGAVAWAIRILDANPRHRGARAFLESAAGPALYVGDAQAALDRAAHNRETQPPLTTPTPTTGPPAGAPDRRRRREKSGAAAGPRV